jgi:hypothetical protein
LPEIKKNEKKAKFKKVFGVLTTIAKHTFILLNAHAQDYATDFRLMSAARERTL